MHISPISSIIHCHKGFISSAISIRAVTNDGITEYLGFSITSLISPINIRYNVKNSEIDMVSIIIE